MNIFQKLPRPFFVLAPLADVTDPAFRRIIAKYSKPNGPHAMWTEFVSADGLRLAPEEGRSKLLKDLEYSEIERPIVAQFFTSQPESMEHAARLARELGFDGVDINMGCPDKSIEKQKAGAALIKDPARAKEVIAAAKAGARELPVSVKTRLGYNKDEVDAWIPHILSMNVAALTIHARTRKEMSLVPARWERVRRVVEIRNEIAPETLIIGNGDARDIADAKTKAEESGADGVMLGRAIFGRPWLFHNSIELWNKEDSLVRRLGIMVEHTKLYEELLPHKSFALMKKHYKAYVKDFDGAGELRARLMEAKDADEVERITNEFCGTVVGT